MIKLKISIIYIIILFVIITPSAQLKVNPTPSQTDLSRLGAKGYFGYVIKSITDQTKQTEVKVGDIIIRTGKKDKTNQCGQLTSAEKFQSDVRSLKAGEHLEVDYLRFDKETGKFIEKKGRLNTFPYGENSAKLGMMGVFGFVIIELDNSVKQTELQVNDVITDVSSLGQLFSIVSFQDKIRTFGINKTISAKIIKFADNNNLSEKEVQIKTFAFPEPLPNPNKSEPPCKLGRCSWCCDICIILENCGSSNCETSNKCISMSGPCNFYTCF